MAFRSLVNKGKSSPEFPGIYHFRVTAPMLKFLRKEPGMAGSLRSYVHTIMPLAPLDKVARPKKKRGRPAKS
jgi:hypothetical protein